MSEGRRRVAVGLEYDGTRYAGWQYQPALLTVQGALQTALARVADHPVDAVCAGRTDAGVHALAQVAHFDTTSTRSPRGWVLGANSLLPDDISLRWACEVDAAFHARHTALARTYRYLILNQPVRPALLRDRVCWIRDALDAEAMQTAGQCLVGEHDFSAFRGAECQSKTPMRRIESLRVWRNGDRLTLEVTANAFLHHMVRNIAGTLLAVGKGERPAAWVGEALASRDRERAGVTAPAAGLYLFAVRYPQQAGLPALAAEGPWAMIAGA